MVVDITAEEAASGEDSTKNGEEAMQEDDNILMEEHQANKRVKMGVNGVNGVNGKSPNSVSSKSSSKAGAKHVEPVCEICSQRLNDQDLRLYPGHPNNSVDEYSVLLDPKLCLFNGDEVDITEGDARALNKITSFSIYDKNGHLCSLDAGLIEKNINIYFSGYVKAIYEEDPSVEGGIPGKDMGPIVEWFVSGFDGGEHANITITTEIGDYVLMEPSEDYAPFMTAMREKSFISKTIIEFLLNEDNPDYEDLLNKLQTTVIPRGLPKFTEDVLLHHAQFICDQILSFDDSAGEEDPLLITAPCIRALIDLAGITFKKGGKTTRKKKGNSRRQEDNWRRGLMRKALKDTKKPSWTKATTTKLVSDMFESFFPQQLAKDEENKENEVSMKRRRCGVCEPCQQPDCGICSACKSMIKFGGPGRSKQACVKRRCPNMEIQEANDEDPEGAPEPDAEPSMVAYRKKLGSFKSRSVSISWVGEPIGQDAKGSFYKAVKLDSEILEVNDYVFIESVDPQVPLQIVKIIYMWESKFNVKMFHATWLWRGSETVLGETSSSSELFLVDDCQDVPVSYIKSKTTVVRRDTPEDWNQQGNVARDNSMDESREDITCFYYQKRYDFNTARFEDPLSDELNYNQNCRPEVRYRFCSACFRCTQTQQRNRPQVHEKLEDEQQDGANKKEVLYGLVKYKDEEIRVGSAVYLQPRTLKFKYPQKAEKDRLPVRMKQHNREVDEERYPEYYRKYNDRVKGTNFDTPEPFDIGYVTKIFATTNVKLLAASSLQICVKKMYRPENTFKGETLKQRTDLNMLYWSEEEVTIPFGQVIGKCYLAYSDNLDLGVEKWSSLGPNRFYFSQMYLSKDEEFDDPPPKACNVGNLVKKSDKIKSKSKKAEHKLIYPEIPPEYPRINKKLRTLDVFAGCGGLSEGLREAGISDNKWAIELDEAAAHAYRINNPETSVFTGDCNMFLRKVMSGENLIKGQSLPKKGEVDLLCGGPPCQGFSGMNRFNSRAYSLFKNSLVVSYLSYCDYYRPRFFVMENVRNFVTFKKSLVLKLTLRCLVRMGYQCTFGVLQAGNFGVPQTRRRMILIAAAPGEVLPRYPNPLHVFSKSACNLSVVIDNKKYFPAYDWSESAPYKVTTVRDALSDLPPIKSGHSEDVMSYSSEAQSPFQRKLRGGFGVSDNQMLLDHICKDLGVLVEARMAHIPTLSGSDWRDLPNVVLPLSDGTKTNKLRYNYHDKKAGVSSTGALRGVCNCATGKECNPLDRQDNTLIPWCLPHTGNRHNNWAGLYGRIEWDGFFSTTITNPEPMGKQGRVLHPEQTRVVSVRECARSQGFPDNFRFYGNIQDKHRQVGNAVPPPLAAAIGMEIRKSISLTEDSSMIVEESN